MLGTVEFASSCFYRYANVDMDQLTRNLGGDAELAQTTLRAFLTGFVEAIPTGKQNSFAAHNPPSLVFTTVRSRGQWSLANAFVDPIRPAGAGHDLIDRSIDALARYWDRLSSLHGPGSIHRTAVAVDERYAPALHGLASSKLANVPEVIEQTVEAARADRAVV